MKDGGECLLCQRLISCSETSVERALSSYVCPLFNTVLEAEFLARWNMMKKYGDRVAIGALILTPPKKEIE
jgi:hypothetical protein